MPFLKSWNNISWPLEILELLATFWKKKNTRKDLFKKKKKQTEAEKTEERKATLMTATLASSFSGEENWGPVLVKVVQVELKPEPRSPDPLLKLRARQLRAVVVLSRCHVRLESFDRALLERMWNYTSLMWQEILGGLGVGPGGEVWQGFWLQLHLWTHWPGVTYGEPSHLQ